MKPLTVGSLFAGIGGFDLGLKRAGFEIKWQVEIDPFCRRVLEKHWPQVRRYEDVRNCYGPERYEQIADDIVASGGADFGPPPVQKLERVDLLCGGFPCQDISLAGKGEGIDGERSGLWSQFDRLIGELRPRYVFVENVSALLGRGMGDVLGDLAACGYDAEWDCIPASAIGAPHQRDRVWIVAYPSSLGHERARLARHRRHGSADSGAEVSDTDNQGESGRTFNAGARRSVQEFVGRNEWWGVEPNVGRVAHGVPARVDRLRGLGNAIVPQIAEWIGRRILEAEEARERLTA